MSIPRTGRPGRRPEPPSNAAAAAPRSYDRSQNLSDYLDCWWDSNVAKLNATQTPSIRPKVVSRPHGEHRRVKHQRTTGAVLRGFLHTAFGAIIKVQSCAAITPI